MFLKLDIKILDADDDNDDKFQGNTKIKCNEKGNPLEHFNFLNKRLSIGQGVVIIYITSKLYFEKKTRKSVYSCDMSKEL